MKELQLLSSLKHLVKRNVSTKCEASMSGSEDIISQEKPAFAKSAKEIKRLHWLTRFNDNFMRLFIKLTPHFCLLRGS